MVKADLGTKRACPSCAARFYDLSKRPIECPKCGTSFEPEALYKQRRGRQPEPAAPVVEAQESEDEEEENEEAEEAQAEDEEADDDLLAEVEDEEDDVAGIIDPGITKDEG